MTVRLANLVEMRLSDALGVFGWELQVWQKKQNSKMIESFEKYIETTFFNNFLKKVVVSIYFSKD